MPHLFPHRSWAPGQSARENGGAPARRRREPMPSRRATRATSRPLKERPVASEGSGAEKRARSTSVRTRTEIGRGETLMTSLRRTSMRGIATAFAIAVLFILGTALEAAADCPVPSMTKPSTAPDLVVSNETCKVGMGTYYYASVNILKGGVLWFQDEKDVHFWAKAI